MPTSPPTAVTYAQPQPVKTLVSGLAGAFQGRAEGAQFNEEQRKFDQSLAENQRQFNHDLAFRVQQLRSMESQNQLDRNQKEQLAALDRQLQDSLQTKAQVFEAGQNELQRALQERMKTAELKQSDIENKRTTAAENYRTKKQWENDMAGRSLQMEQMFDKQQRLDAGGELLAKGVTGEDFVKQYVAKTVPSGGLTGEYGFKVSPDQIAQREAEARALLLPGAYEAERKRQATELEALAVAQSRGQSVGQIAVESAKANGYPDALGKRATALTDLFEVGKNVVPNEATGLPPMRKDSFVAMHYGAEITELDHMLATFRDDQLPSFGMDEYSRNLPLVQFKDNLHSKLLEMDHLKPEERDLLEQAYTKAAYDYAAQVPSNEAPEATE